ncbi:MAG TPA: HAD family hydrolase [Candidatus Atribacteria bacterium]|nr:HAD family hydrolase [Candidatus Atribacteria bacterium]
MIKKIGNYKHIIWDWNGTLINDAWLAVEVMNKMLKKRHLPRIDSKKYREIFDFPVTKYYLKLGYDFSQESFERLSDEFISEYYRCFNKCELFDEVEEVLKKIKERGISQSILSASKEDVLKEKIKHYGIDKYFDRIIGLENHYAESKIEKGKKWIDQLNLHPQEVLLIGDTIHDYDVARCMGCDCLLVANGHQNYERLADQAGVEVISSLKEITINTLKKDRPKIE